MNLIRGLGIWLGASLLASILCTTALSVITGLMFTDWRTAVPVGLGSLAYTIVGSAFLSCLFAAIGAQPIIRRYIVIIAVGALAGAAMMLASGMPLGGLVLGAVYGFVTACFWVALYRSFHRTA